jgi:hypothetical protein
MKGYINGVQGLNFLAFFVGKIQKNLFTSMNGRENFRDDCAILAGRQDQWSATMSATIDIYERYIYIWSTNLQITWVGVSWC